MAQITFTRKELHELVWSTPMTTLTQKYKITNNDLKRICTSLQIPLPNSSYWSSLRVGKSVSIPALSSKYDGKETTVLSLRDEEISDNPLAILKSEIENDINLPLKVPVRLYEPDVLIIQAKKKLLADKPHSFHKGLVSTGSDELSISVTPENIRRSLLFMDTLIKLIRARGHNIIIKGYITYAIIYDEQFEISLREKVKRMPDNNWENRYQPTGELIFSFRVGRLHTIELNDGKNILIEHKLSTILAKLEMKSKEEKEQRISIEKYWQDFSEKEQIKREIEERREKELSDFKKMILDARRWYESTILHNYLDNLESKAISNKALSNELIEKIQWGRKKADWYDPMINADDELLQNIDPNSIIFKKS